MARLLIMKAAGAHRRTKLERNARAARDADFAATFAENQHNADYLSRTLDPDYAGKKRAEADAAHEKFQASARRMGFNKPEVQRPGSRGGHARTNSAGHTTYKLVNGGHWTHKKRADGQHDVRSPQAGDFFKHPSGHVALALQDHPTSGSHPIMEHDPTGDGLPSTPLAPRRPVGITAQDLVDGTGPKGKPQGSLFAKAKRLIMKALGDRGGKVIGTTKSGKPIYDRHNHPSHATFTPQDHSDAVMAHADHGIGTPNSHEHYYQAMAHQDARDRIEDEDKRDTAAEAAEREAHSRKLDPSGMEDHRKTDIDHDLDAAMHKASTSKKNKPLIGKDAFKQPKKVLDGETSLGKTKSGKPIFASGSDTAGYNDDDHRDAAARHIVAHRRHAAAVDVHRTIADKDDDWRRSEEHGGEVTRHQKLAEHHLELARHHLTAGGHSASATLKFGEDGKAEVGERVPDDDKARQQAKDALAARTHHTHPGGLTERDRAAYTAPED